MKFYYRLRAKSLRRKIADNPNSLKQMNEELSEYNKKIKDIHYERRLKKRAFLQDKFLPAIYRHYAKKPIIEKSVMLVYDKSFTMPDNLKQIQKELERRNEGYKIVPFLAIKNSRFTLIKQLQNFLYFARFTKIYARMENVVLIEFFLPLYANKPREGTHVIQLWHACGAFKKWGWATADSKWGLDRYTMEKFPIHTNYTHVTVSSPQVIPKYAEAFNMPEENIDAFGSPRTDVFFDKKYIKKAEDKFYKMHPQLKGKKLVLYSPTFRGNSIKNSFNRDLLHIEYLRARLGDEYCIVYKLHPLVANAFELAPEYENFAVDVSKTMEINQMLCIADIVISDYSSLIFEFSLMLRPMIFFAYDLDEYTDSRDFFYDYEEMVPGVIAKTNGELADAILNAEEQFDLERMKQFRDYFMSACDGNSTNRIIDKYIAR